MVVDRNSKQRSIPCDTVLGTTLFVFRSVHEEIEVFVSIMMSVSLSNKRKPLKLRHCRAHLQGTTQRLVYFKLAAEDRQKNGEEKMADWSRPCTELKTQHRFTIRIKM